MPAYIVNEAIENTGGVVFAKDKRTALKWGADEYADGEIDGVEATRRKDLDRYEAIGVPAKVLVEEGWWFECSGCGMHIRDFTLEEAGMKEADVVGTVSGQVYCCHACRTESLAEEAAKKAFGRGFQDMLRDMVRDVSTDAEPGAACRAGTTDRPKDAGGLLARKICAGPAAWRVVQMEPGHQAILREFPAVWASHSAQQNRLGQSMTARATMPQTALKEMIQAAIDAGLTIREIISEPDGTQRVLTDRKEERPMLDALSEARAKRAAKGDRHVDGHKAAG